MEPVVAPQPAPTDAPGRSLRPAWRHALEPVPRVTAFYGRSLRRWLQPEGADPLPVVRPTPALAAHALLDEALVAGFKVVRSVTTPPRFARIEDEARAAVEVFEDAGWLRDPRSYFADPPPLADPTVRRARSRNVDYERFTFESAYEPHPGEPGRSRWLGYESNRKGRAWVLRHPDPRPWLVCIHGARMGRPAVDLAMFRARWLHHDLGLNVAMPVLPLHGPRGHGRPRGADFPGDDILDNVHGFAQAVWDIRRLLAWIRADEQPVGISGVSLGGYVGGLLAGIDADLACAILGVPLVDLTDVVDRHSHLRHDAARTRAMELARRLDRAVSPLALDPLIPLERRFIYAGVADRLVQARRQVLRLWEHWDRPAVTWYPGGHVGFFRSPPVGRFVKEALATSGLVAPRS